MKKWLVNILLVASLSSSSAMAAMEWNKGLVGTSIALGVFALASLGPLIVSATTEDVRTCDDEEYPVCCSASVVNGTIVATDPNDCPYTPDSECSGNTLLFCADGYSQMTLAPFKTKEWVNPLLYVSGAVFSASTIGARSTSIGRLAVSSSSALKRAP